VRTDGRRVALAVTVLAGLGFVLVAALWVPWHPVPGGPVQDVPVGSVFSAAEIARAEHFARWARVWSWSSLAVSLLVVCLLGFSDLGRRLVARLPGRWWVQVVLAVALVLLVGRVATLPLDLAAQAHRRDHGLSTQSWAGYLSDVGRGWGVNVLVTSLAMLVLVGCARRWRRAWPAVAGPALAGLVVLGSFAYPVLVEPMFNTFTPLPDSSLRTAVLDLAEREGVPVDEVLVADASRRTTTLNAYVSGFGSTRRVVLYDTLVDDLPQDQALSVVAHELAHARHRDVVLGTALAGLGVAFGVGLLGLVAGLGRSRRELGEPTVVPWVLAVVAVGTLLASPVQNLVSRQIETRADVDALLATRDGPAFVAMQRELALRSLNDPTPPAWSQLWFGSHPTVLRRLAIAERLAP
jgi:STE24 endopeptidase